MSKPQGVFRIVLPALGLLLSLVTGPVLAQTQQERVHHHAHTVMPFDISHTEHVFKMTEWGGVQRVVARDPEAREQIARIRQHLRHETQRFQQGDYGDPARLHGTDMPGLAELTSAGGKVQVSYAEVPGGAEIHFQTADLQLLTAVHRWFGAQLSEHGADARAE